MLRCWRVWLIVYLAMCLPLSAMAQAWTCHSPVGHSPTQTAAHAPCHDAAAAPDLKHTSPQQAAQGSHCLGCHCPGCPWGLNTLSVPPAVALGPLRPVPLPAHRLDSAVPAGLERPPRTC